MHERGGVPQLDKYRNFYILSVRKSCPNSYAKNGVVVCCSDAAIDKKKIEEAKIFFYYRQKNMSGRPNASPRHGAVRQKVT